MSETPTSAPHPIFTPTAISPERLDDVTVGREDIIGRVADRVRDAARSGARRHTLLVGARGSGKTHTLAVAVHRALADPDVGGSVVVAWIPEDSLSIGSYRDLLVEAARSFGPSWATRAQSLRRAKDTAGLERLLEEYAGDRALVLVVENLDRVFQGLRAEEAGALRGFVETSGRVLVLASTPLLFSGVTSRKEPWYGSFDVEHLGELTVTEGAEIVRRRAHARGNPELAGYVMSDEGQARLRAIAHLAGGSPRLWQILADAVTISSLDELVPAVEKLLDELAPYYQQRLWELGGIDQKLVVELGRAQGAMTVAELADLTGVEARAAATALGRLSEASWVRSAKSPGGDQRKSWYELREPLLRHHLQYRDTQGEPLRVVVEVLRGWYSIQDRRRQLAWAPAGSVTERFLAHTMRSDPPGRSDSAYADRDPDELMTEVRSWRLGTCTSAVTGSPELADAIERAIDAARGASAHVPDAIGDSLEALGSGAWSKHDGRVLELLTACWNGVKDPLQATARLASLRSPAAAGPFDLAIDDEFAYWTGEAGDPAGARDQFAALLPDRIRVLGPDHADTLTTRANLAYWTGEAGDPAGARDQFAALLPDRIRVLGPDHADTLTTRANLAYWTGEAGDPAGARDQFAALLPDRIRVLGPDHADTLNTRANLASWTGEAGDPEGARDQFAALLPDRIRVLGPDHADTLNTRANLAHWTGEAGDPEGARDQFAALLPDRIRVLGLDHADTLNTRANLAHWTGEAGDPAGARDQYAALLPDRIRVLGPDHPQTAATRRGLAQLTFESGASLREIAWSTRELRDWAGAYASGVSLSPIQAAALAVNVADAAGDESADDVVPFLQLLRFSRGKSSRQWLADYQDAGGPASDRLIDLAAAMDGDAEATMRLPEELRRFIGHDAVEG